MHAVLQRGIRFRKRITAPLALVSVRKSPGSVASSFPAYHILGFWGFREPAL